MKASYTVKRKMVIFDSYKREGIRKSFGKDQKYDTILKESEGF